MDEWHINRSYAVGRGRHRLVLVIVLSDLATDIPPTKLHAARSHDAP
jgi:hypothetical protein